MNGELYWYIPYIIIPCSVLIAYFFCRSNHQYYQMKEKDLELDYARKKAELKTLQVKMDEEYRIKSNQLSRDFSKYRHQLELQYDHDVSARVDELSRGLNEERKEVETIRQYLNNSITTAQQFNQEIRRIKLDCEARIEDANKKYLDLKFIYDNLVTLHPTIIEDIEEDVEEVEKVEESSNGRPGVLRWLSDEEYNGLSQRGRNELAFSRWKFRRKSKPEIGMEYEVYIGYCYWKEGWKVDFHGVDNGKNDLGRDIIATKVIDGIHHVHIIQCKYWSKKKNIHENTICQLFGTTFKYIFEHGAYKNGNYRIKPILATTTELSDVAKEFAKRLHVKYKVSPIGEIPWIKCNINNGNKIYHLPFDQQYERVKIDYNKKEFYAFTIEEAESKGFRHAMRHFNH